jgi:light-regulated signal transduction histidine kinase (bacteriophytochrome)
MIRRSVAEQYRLALGRFVETGEESELEHAYEIGRQALQCGLTLTEIGEIHYAVTRDIMAGQQVALSLLHRSEGFFLQISSVYDMALRGYRDTIARLQVEIDERMRAETELHELTNALRTERDHLELRVSERTYALQMQAEKLQRSNEVLKRRNQELDDFAHIASHDLKEPLRAISNHASFLQEDCQNQLSEEARHRLVRLVKLSGRMTKLIADLFHYSSLSRTEHQPETVDLNSIISDIEAALADTLEARNARITTETPLPSVTGNRALLMALFQNLISNGTKYNDSAEKLVEIGRVPESDGAADAYETVYVRDNGIGIAPEFHQDIFRMFKRLNSEKAYGEGTGAGLTFVKKIVEHQDGKIRLTSQPGKGTTFFVSLVKAPSTLI